MMPVSAQLMSGNAQLRRSVYALLAALAFGAFLGRLIAVDSVDRRALEEVRLRQIPTELEKYRARLVAKGLRADQVNAAVAEYSQTLYRQARLCRPFLSANDRSRWATVRALVEPEMRVPGAPYAIDRVIQDPLWDTIDMVKHDGHLYSSKPPFLATIMAGLYWPVYHLFGYSLADRPYLVGRMLLALFNGTLLVIYFWIVAQLLERYGRDDLSRIFVFGATCFGTFLTPFAVTFNNHLPGAVAAAVALYFLLRIYIDGVYKWSLYLGCGLAAGLTAACEMPALAFAALCAGLLLLPARLDERFCQESRKLGPEERGLSGTAAGPAATFWRRVVLFLVGFLPAFAAVATFYFATNWIAHRSLRPPYMHRSTTNPADNWYVFTYERQGRVIQSYWTNPIGIDRGEPNALVYAVHVLVGHHGIFSLTPIWLLAVGGMVVGIAGRHDPRLRLVFLGLLVVSIVCVGFYLARPQMDRNYGGVASGFRWAFWLAPLWLFAMLGAVEVLAKTRIGWALCLAALLLSVLSVHYPTWNPWVHPWLYDWFFHLGWLRE
ncbi:MAG: hypothetical protein NZ899_07650 [Thermoguttaceae bacterium]|nr:hypothetical protein [Thermoguttaceae bacterium]MDW8079017.1 hypothetical protein [Thermoguttaceae bacterium]